MPVGLNVAYNSPLHTKIIDAIRARWKLCHTKAQDRYDAWSKAEDQALAYMKPTAKDSLREQRKRDGKPQYVTLQIPYSYAQMLAAHTYETAVFLSRSPIHQYDGRYGATVDSTQALEAIIDYQVQVGQMLVPYYIWLMDKRKYGVGILGTYWDVEVSQVSSIVEQPVMWAGIPVPGMKPRKVRQVSRMTSYEGNRVYNVRPVDFIFDPRVTLANFQKGEFAGRYVEVGWNYIAKKAEAGEFINTDVLARSQPRGWWRERGTSQLNTPTKTDNGESVLEGVIDFRNPTQNLGYVELCEIVIELIPKDWGLGSSSYPEKWCFVVGNDRVLLEARPQGLLHNQFPYDVIEHEIEGYGLFKRGMMEVLEPLNDTLTWLFNTHFFNVRRTMNDQIVADPQRVVVKDLENPEEGRIIRLKPEAYGTDWRQAIGQLQVVDVTQNHISRDSSVVMDLLQRLAGVSEGGMGVLDPGGRKTATEVRQANSFGLGRQKTEAEFASAQGWAPHSQKLVQNTQQFYDGDKQFKLAGNLMERAGQLVQVTPEAIAGFWDFLPVDGTMPIDRYAQAALWQQLLTGMANFPSLMMQYDLGRIFAYVAQLAGVKNVDRFKLDVQPDQALLAQAQAGNVVPLRGGQNGGSGPAGRTGGPATGGATGFSAGLPAVAPVPGMGPTG